MIPMKRINFLLLVFCITALHKFAVAQGVRGTAIGSPIPNQPVPTHSTNTNSSPSETKDGYLHTGFDQLSGFPARVIYEAANSNSMVFESRLATPLPDNIKALDSRKVSVSGFMLPLQVQEGRVTEFILLKNQMMCCYGKPPLINEWIHVKMSNGVKPAMDQTISVFGTLHVTEYKENSQMLGLYRLDGVKTDATGS
jgi:hypothetical protein